MAKGKGGFIGQDGINAPDPATDVTGTAGDGQVTVSWTAPSDVGGAAINGYAISSNPSVPIALPSLATASYTSKSFSLASQGSGDIFFGMTFNSDGTKAYFTGYGAASIFQYSLSTAWDISTTSYDNVTLSTSGQTSSGQSGLVFSPDGTKLYMVSYNTDTVYQYTLTTPFDLSSGSYANKSLSVSSQDSNPQDMYIKPDGTKLYVLGDTNNSVFQYSMSTPFDLATASYDSVSFATTSQQTNPTGLFFSPDGTTILICGYSPKSADKYTLSTPWVVSSASHVKSYTLTELSSGYPNSIFAGNDLSNMFVAGGNVNNTDGTIFQYNVGMPTESPFVYGGLTNGTSYTFNVWAINPFGWSSPSDASVGATPSGFAFWVGGATSGDNWQNVIQKASFSTLGNASDWGDLTVARGKTSGCSSATRGLAGGGRSSGGDTNVIDYYSLSSSGNATDFGNLVATVQSPSALANSTRGVWGGGETGVRNATDFGDLTATTNFGGGASNSTRALFTYNLIIGYVTIASTGNATDFGDLISNSNPAVGAASGTRALFGTGSGIQYVEIASTGNAQDFGDLTFTQQGSETFGSGSTSHGGLS